ncbi:MAG: hypothetical protein IKT52_05835 [Oscillospiraceae bacterium]|nr:hypothetical protein [Oscillospiraceae bacterium]
MATENPFMNSLKEKGLIDNREIAFVADVTCTNGNRGRAWFFLNGRMLHLYEMTGMAAWGEHIETLDLKGAEVLKSSSFVLGSSLKLKCDNKTYTFNGFAQAKKVIACITESCNV